MPRSPGRALRPRGKPFRDRKAAILVSMTVLPKCDPPIVICVAYPSLPVGVPDAIPKDSLLFPSGCLSSDHRRSPAFGRRRLRDIALPRPRGQTESAHADAVEFAQSFPGVSVNDGRRPASTSPEVADAGAGAFVYNAAREFAAKVMRGLLRNQDEDWRGWTMEVRAGRALGVASSVRCDTTLDPSLS